MRRALSAGFFPPWADIYTTLDAAPRVTERAPGDRLTGALGTARQRPLRWRCQASQIRLRLPDPEYLGSASRARPLGRRSPVLHGDLLRVADLPGGAAFHAVGLHREPLPTPVTVLTDCLDLRFVDPLRLAFRQRTREYGRSASHSSRRTPGHPQGSPFGAPHSRGSPG